MVLASGDSGNVTLGDITLSVPCYFEEKRIISSVISTDGICAK